MKKRALMLPALLAMTLGFGGVSLAAGPDYRGDPAPCGPCEDYGYGFGHHRGHPGMDWRGAGMGFRGAPASPDYARPSREGFGPGPCGRPEGFGRGPREGFGPGDREAGMQPQGKKDKRPGAEVLPPEVQDKIAAIRGEYGDRLRKLQGDLFVTESVMRALDRSVSPDVQVVERTARDLVMLRAQLEDTMAELDARIAEAMKPGKDPQKKPRGQKDKPAVKPGAGPEPRPAIEPGPAQTPRPGGEPAPIPEHRPGDQGGAGAPR